MPLLLQLAENGVTTWPMATAVWLLPANVIVLAATKWLLLAHNTLAGNHAASCQSEQSSYLSQ